MKQKSDFAKKLVHVKGERRLNRQYVKNIHPLFKTKYGTTNFKSPDVIFVFGNTQITPHYESSDYSEAIDKLRYNFKTGVRSAIGNSSFDCRKYISNFNIADSGIKNGKKSCLTFELYLKQKETHPISEVCPDVEEIIRKVCETFVNTANSLNFSFDNEKTIPSN